MLISGHKTRSVFDRYVITDPKETEAALEKVGFEYHFEYQQPEKRVEKVH